MNRQIKILAACLVLLVVLGGALAYALLGIKNTPAEESSSTGESIPILSFGEALTEITITNASGTLHAVKTNGTFSIRELDGLPAAADRIDALVIQAQALNAKHEISADAVQALSEYGLDIPAVTVHLTAGQEEKTLFIGGQAPASMGTYVSCDDKLYVMDNVDIGAFSFALEDFVSNEITEPLKEGETVSHVTLSHLGEDAPIELDYVLAQQKHTASTPASDGEPANGEANSDSEQNGAQSSSVAGLDAASGSSSENAEEIPAFYRMTAPQIQDLTPYDVSGWLDGVFGLTAQGVAAIRPTGDAVASFGLDAPQSVLTVTTSTGKTLRLSASAPVADICYVMRSDIPLIYRLPQDSLPWLSITPETLTGNFLLTSPEVVQELRISASQEAYRFTRRDDTAAAASASEQETEEHTILLESEKFDELVKTVLHVNPQMLQTVPDIKLEPVANIAVSYQTPEKTDDVLSLVPTGEGELYLVLNGECIYKTGESVLQMLLDACKKAAEAAAAP